MAEDLGLYSPSRINTTHKLQHYFVLPLDTQQSKKGLNQNRFYRSAVICSFENKLTKIIDMPYFLHSQRRPYNIWSMDRQLPGQELAWLGLFHFGVDALVDAVLQNCRNRHQCALWLLLCFSWVLVLRSSLLDRSRQLPPRQGQSWQGSQHHRKRLQHSIKHSLLHPHILLLLLLNHGSLRGPGKLPHRNSALFHIRGFDLWVCCQSNFS